MINPNSFTGNAAIIGSQRATFITELRCENKRGTFLPLSTGRGFRGPQMNFKYSHVYVTGFKE